MMDKFRLDGKTSMVTGGSRGIGLGIAAAMTKGGIRQLTKALAVEWARHGIH